jgi:hypothetical protein
MYVVVIQLEKDVLQVLDNHNKIRQVLTLPALLVQKYKY